MAKVLFLVNHEVVIYNFRLELVQRLLQEGHEVWVCCPYGERMEQLKAIGCNYVDVEITRHGTDPLKDFKLMLYYRRILRDILPDIVFTYTIKPNIYGAMACRSRKIPCIMNITGLGKALENPGLLQKLTLGLYRMALPGVQKVFFQNEENRNFFLDRRLVKDNHGLLPGSGVNLQRFSLLPYPQTETVEFAFIARIMEEKGIDQYLEAARTIREKYPNTRFHVCGFCEPEYEGKLSDCVNDGVVEYHGMVSDIRRIHERVHCVVHPTYYPEGLSNVLLEACASGRSIITTDRSGCREVVEDGVNGFVVCQKDSRDLVRQLEKFLALSREEKIAQGLAGRRKVEQEFDRQIVVEAYLRELESCAEKLAI